MHPGYQKGMYAISKEQSRILCLNFQSMLRMMLKSGQRITNPPSFPPLAVLPPKISDQNFGIAILFKIVDKSNNYTSGNELIPTAPGTSVVSYISCQYLYARFLSGERGIFDPESAKRPKISR